ncbi:MAG TPA: TetR/AcrR family transcriptional regulator [Marmoricola sp.]
MSGTRQPSAQAAKADGRQTRWDEHKAERRRQILEAAVAVIERGEPGEEVHVQQIAEESGVGRSVIYRHFADRADLDRAVQGYVLGQLRDLLLEEVALTGTIEQIILRIVSTYVSWAAEHPELHRLAEREPTTPRGDVGELELAVKALVDEVVQIILLGAAVVGVELSEDDALALEPLIFGVVGMAFGTVRRWLWRDEREPSPDALSTILAQTIWWAIHGMAHDRGVDLDPHVPLEDMIAAVVSDLVDD